MAATTNYQAGLETNDTIVSYAQELAWGVLPAVAFKQIRFTGESLTGTKTRTRPTEINARGEVPGNITTQESAGGGLNFALSYGTFDDLLAAALNTEWSAAGAGNSVPAGITGTPAGFALNGVEFHSFTFQKRFSNSVFLRYPGSFISAMTLNGSVGQFLTGSFTFISQVELPFTLDGSTGAPVAAPGGPVNDPVNGFTGIYLDGAKVDAVVDSFTLSITNTGAAAQFGMGSSGSQGVIKGLSETKGTLNLYFNSFEYYTRFKSEQQGLLQIVSKDGAGNGYCISLFQAALMNPKVMAGGQNKAVMATFDLEGNPRAAGGTVQIDRLTA